MIKSIVIGAGRIALSHIPHVVTHADAEIVGIVEPSFALRLVMKRLLKVPVFKSLESMKGVEFDAAFILTPPQSHFQLASELLERGKHVFLEKPLSLDPVESHAILDLAKKNNVQFSCGYVYRHHPIYLKIRDIISQQTYGKPVSCDIRMIGNVVNADSPKTWRSTGKGAGCLYDYGCHAIDLSLFVFGVPDGVTCHSKEELFQEGVIDKFSATLSHHTPETVTSNIYCDWADQTVRKAALTVEIKTATNTITTDGQAITISGETDLYISIRDLDTDVSYYLRGEEFQKQMDSFLGAISSGNLDYSNSEDAAICDDILLEIYEAKI